MLNILLLPLLSSSFSNCSQAVILLPMKLPVTPASSLKFASELVSVSLMLPLPYSNAKTIVVFLSYHIQ